MDPSAQLEHRNAHWMPPIAGAQTNVDQCKHRRWFDEHRNKNSLKVSPLGAITESCSFSLQLVNLQSVRNCKEVCNLIIDKITSRLE